VGLYEEPEKPSSALEFIQNHLHPGGAQSADMENMKAENAELKKTIDQVCSPSFPIAMSGRSVWTFAAAKLLQSAQT
jgi:hypothetical protein